MIVFQSMEIIKDYVFKHETFSHESKTENLFSTSMIDCCRYLYRGRYFFLMFVCFLCLIVYGLHNAEAIFVKKKKNSNDPI